MKQHCSLYLICILCLLLGCSGDTTTGPDPDDGTYTLEETQTVGAAGGTIEIDDFSLTVPAGAFDGDHTLKLFASSEDRPFDQNQVTRAFRLVGLPDDFSLPLRLSIKYEGTLSEESLVALGGRFFDYVRGDSVTAFGPYVASDSSGHLVCEIPPDSSETMRPQQAGPNATFGPYRLPVELVVTGLTGYDTRYIDHFWIAFPKNLIEVSAPAVDAMLEEIYTNITTDFGFEWPSQIRLNVFVEDLGPSIGASTSFVMRHTPMLAISRQHLSRGDFTAVRVDVGKQLLSWILLGYDESGLDPGHSWLWHAIVAWSEEVFTDDAQYAYPGAFPGNEMAPFNGMKAGAGDGSDADQDADHGHGMSAVIKCLVDDSGFGMGGIKATYEAIEAGSDPAAALLNEMDAIITEWWPDFFRDYVGGGIYGVGGDVFTNSQNLSGTWTVDSGNDTLASFAGDCPDLSANLYLVNLSYGSLDESASLMLTLTGELTTPVCVMAFRVDGTSVGYLGSSASQGSAALEVPNLRDLVAGGLSKLLVVAVNSDVSETFLDESNLDLEMKIRTKPAIPGFDSFDFLIRVVGQWHYVSGDFTSDYEDELEEEPWGLIDVIPGEMTDETTFEGSFESEGDSIGVIATFSPEMDSVLTLSLEMTSEPQDGRRWSHSFDVRGVPISDDLEDWAWFRVDGAAACTYLDDVQYMYANPSADESRTLTGYYCTSEGSYPSLLILHFHKE
ncbi:MAG: hypothetical protein PVJ42_07520 [bacterium]|jgi:hypothetical protein